MSEHAEKRYIVTGAASGIGAAVARQLLDQGATVYSLDRNTPEVGVHKHIPVDLADRVSIDKAVAELDGTFDSLIQVAGVPGTAPGDVVVAVNTLAVRHLTESLMGRLATGGNVTVVSSTAGFGWPLRLDVIKEFLATESFEEGARWFAEHPQQGNAYNFSKEATTVYVMTMALGLNEMGLRINAVLPGPVETPILADFEETMGKDALDGVKEMLGRHGRPDDIANAVLFLASASAEWVNGATLVVDGGIMSGVATGLVPVPEI